MAITTLQRSRSFKVTDFATNRKPIYDFLLVINSNWILRATFHLASFPSYGWLYAKFWLEIVGCYNLTPSLGWNPSNIAISDIPLKTRFFGLHFIRRMYPCIFNHFYVIRPQSYWILRNNSNYTAITLFNVIQGHWSWYQSKAHERLPISD